jgi:chondroitin AC lyase
MLTDVTVSIQNVKGDWKRVFPTWPWGEAAGDVFSIWIDHGKSPEGATYAYTLFPKIAEDMMDSTTAATILSNTESVQAVTLNGDLSAVFYAPGKINFDGTTVRVDKPCILMQRKGQLYISDPTQKEKTITVSQGKKSTTVKLPTGQMAGSPAEVSILEWKPE